MMRRFFLLTLLIGTAFILGCGQGEYDNRLKQNINNPKGMAAAPAPVEEEEEEEGAAEEDDGGWTLEELEAEDAARANE